MGAPVPEEPEIPAGTERAWQIWQRLSTRRAIGEVLQPLQYTEIQAFSELSGKLICPDDLLLIETIDDAFLRSYSAELAAKQADERERAKLEGASKPKGNSRRR